MNPTVLAALIGSITSIVICLFTSYQQNKKRRLDEAIRDAKLELKLSNIEKKLDEHNGYADKISSIQQDISFIKGKLEKGA